MGCGERAEEVSVGLITGILEKPGQAGDSALKFSSCLPVTRTRLWNVAQVLGPMTGKGWGRVRVKDGVRFGQRP